MSAAARPYDFDELDGADAGEPETVYSAADLHAAREEARAEALDAVTAKEAAEQTRALAAIAERLEAGVRERNEAIAAQAASLVAIARDLVRAICVGATGQEKGDAALALLKRYLAAAPSKAPARLLISDKTPKSAIAAICKAVKDRGADVAVETSADIAPGEARIDWRDGAMARDLGEILAQIETIFAGVENDSASKRTSKEKAS